MVAGTGDDVALRLIMEQIRERARSSVRSVWTRRLTPADAEPLARLYRDTPAGLAALQAVTMPPPLCLTAPAQCVRLQRLVDAPPDEWSGHAVMCRETLVAAVELHRHDCCCELICAASPGTPWHVVLHGVRAALDDAVRGWGCGLVEAYLLPDDAVCRDALEAAGFTAAGAVAGHRIAGGAIRDLLLFRLVH